MNQKAREVAKQTVKTIFKNDYNEPFELTDGQTDIFNAIFTKAHPRTQIITPTQYGKSDTISMAVLTRVVAFKENFAIISGSKDKAQIIMSRVIQHTFDNPMFYKQLELDKDMSLDRLKRERSKDHITFMHGGSIRTFTANTKNKQSTKEALTGFGSPNIIEDEAALIPDDVQAMILRMLGGHKNNFLLKIGNPFYRNHFYRTSQSSKYYNILIDYHQALREGRFTPEFIEEMRNEAFFDILYECKFPEEGEFFEGGYRKLFHDDLIKNAFISEEEGKKLISGKPKLGADFAGGGNDKSAYVIRYPKVMFLLSTNRIADTMQQVPIIEEYIDKYKIDESDVMIDVGGLGQGIGDRLHEKDIQVVPIMFGQSPPDTVGNDGINAKEKYKNMRAFMYYEFLKWLKEGGKIVRNDGFLELSVVNYKQSSEKKLQIQPKEELKKLLIENNIKASSPDIADAAALTFAYDGNYVDDDDFEII